MGTVSINGKTYTGQNISIVDGRVKIDGVMQGEVNGVVEIRVIEGEIGELTTNASVQCGNVRGNLFARGSVTCDDVGGSITCGGSVCCDAVKGNISAGGSVAFG